MKEILVTRVEHFNAAHRLFNESWDDEKNNEVFGKCSNPHYHGHNYELHVTVKGKIDPDTGYAINASIVKDIVRKYVIDIADHRNLNVDVPFMAGKLTTSENFAVAIWDQLVDPIREAGGTLYKILLFETKNIYVEYYGH